MIRLQSFISTSINNTIIMNNYKISETPMERDVSLKYFSRDDYLTITVYTESFTMDRPSLDTRILIT